MPQRMRWQLALVVVLVAIDQMSKWWIEQQSEMLHLVVIPGFFNIIKAHNSGVAFSMLADLPPEWGTMLILGMTIGIALVVLLWWWRGRYQQSSEGWWLALVLAGAIGNIWDRSQLGYVVDFIQWFVVIDGHAYIWPAFNVADSAISVAVAGLIVTSFRLQRS
ncbi:MAG: signal peptidase II [Mariprofundales bacterium]|nr:signal peptidase II [Mariprofundales bacterium]